MPILNTPVFKAYSKIGLLLLLFALCYVVDLALLSLIFGFEKLKYVVNGQEHFASVFYIVLLYVSILLAAIFFAHRTGIIFGDFLAPDKFKRSFVNGVLYALVLFAVFFLPAFIPGLFYSDVISYSLRDILGHLVINLLSSFAIAFAEEFIFRGVIYHTFKNHLSVTHSIISTSVIFALAHMFSHFSHSYKILFFISLFLLSYLFCLGNIKARSLFFSAGCHFTLIYLLLIRNYFGLLKIPNESSNIVFGLANSPMSGIYAVTILLAAVIFMKRQLTYEKR